MCLIPVDELCLMPRLTRYPFPVPECLVILMISWSCLWCLSMYVTASVKIATPIDGSENIHEDTDLSFCHSRLGAFSCPNLHRSHLHWLRCNPLSRWRPYRQCDNRTQRPTFGQLRWPFTRLR